MLKVENISFQYKEHKVLKDISFEVPDKSVTCIIGPNGSGKTTLLDCIMGIHDDYSGDILLNNENVKKFKVNERMQSMSYVPQSKNHTFPFTVKEMVIMGRAPYLSFFEHPSKLEEELALNALDEIGIGSYKERIFTKLSGGEQQLVILARALVQDTEMLILDEPMVSLDYFNELQFLEILIKLIREHGKSIIMATHSPNHAFYFKERNIITNVLMLKNGKLIGYSSPENILSAENMRKVYNINASIISYNNECNYIIPISTNGERNEKNN